MAGRIKVPLGWGGGCAAVLEGLARKACQPQAQVAQVAPGARNSHTDGVTFPMSEARIDTTEASRIEASAQAAAAGYGKHRGPASLADDQSASPHGKHRRPAEAN